MTAADAKLGPAALNVCHGLMGDKLIRQFAERLLRLSMPRDQRGPRPRDAGIPVRAAQKGQYRVQH
jgi:hypothetical protein